MSPGDLSALWLTLKLAGLVTLILLLLGTPLAWWLAHSRCRLKPVIEALVALPIVLPPSVLGFYLLVALGPHGPIGQVTQSLGLGTLSFTFAGLVLASIIYSLPFVVQPLQQAFAAIPPGLYEAAATLRARPLDRWLSIALPLARPGFLTAGILGFAHTLGEFGVVLMVGGNIEGETRVVSVQIYDHVEAMDYGAAHRLALTLLTLSFLILVLLYRQRQPWRL